MGKWSVEQSKELYNISEWGAGFFDINAAGHIDVHPNRNPNEAIDLRVLVNELQERDIQLPLLVRFSDILRERIAEINDSFSQAIEECNYNATYRGVYPIKVNEQRHVLESILEEGRSYHFGLEAGSKPELLTVLGLIDDPEALVICNGYKDEEFIELALLGKKLGINIVLVVEKFTELPIILDCAERLNVEPNIGLRVRLSQKGAGKWEASGGDRAKFGLGALEIMRSIELLKEKGKIDCLKLLHYHLGSQICSISTLRSALREATRYLIEINNMGADLKYLDVGGGLAVDYDGSRSNMMTSANYSVQEYANTVVYEIQTACDEAKIKHPIIVSESGRALTAYHSVLITNVLGRTQAPSGVEPFKDNDNPPQQVQELFEVAQAITAENFQESYHDVQDLREQILDLFRLGYISLHFRAMTEGLYWSSLKKIYEFAQADEHAPPEFDKLRRELSDIYFVNMSIFQSLPDSWAIDQVFPIMPIHKLEERPEREAILADITCDSDGKIDQFVDYRNVRTTLPLHDLNEDENYLIGIFLVGAYQEILGDLHNLFGDNNAVHVSWDSEAQAYSVDHVEYGDTVTEVLNYVQHSREDLVNSFRKKVEKSARKQNLSIQDVRHIVNMYRAGFDGYTYFE